jgi:hypothetical protein
MFMDGVKYAAISRNMAEGIGSFWRPFFAHSFWLPYDNGPYFSGHPPLQFGLQALLFRLLGDTPVVENVYNLLILTTHIGLIAGIWKQLLPVSIDRLQGNRSIIYITNHFIDKLFIFVDTRRFYLYL